MTLLAEKFVGKTDNLGMRVAEALKNLNEPLIENSEIHLLGPFPVFVINTKDFINGKTRSAIKRSGWRGIILTKNQPIALVDFSPPEKDGKFSINVRGRQTAKASMLALRAAEKQIDPRGNYKVRFVTVTGLFITGLWLAGRKFSFIPTRVGSGARPAPRLYDRMDFLRLIKKQLSTAKQSLILKNRKIS
jgi:hypothetical protein